MVHGMSLDVNFLRFDIWSIITFQYMLNTHVCMNISAGLIFCALLMSFFGKYVIDDGEGAAMSEPWLICACAACIKCGQWSSIIGPCDWLGTDLYLLYLFIILFPYEFIRHCLCACEYININKSSFTNLCEECWTAETRKVAENWKPQVYIHQTKCYLSYCYENTIIINVIMHCVLCVLLKQEHVLFYLNESLMPNDQKQSQSIIP